MKKQLLLLVMMLLPMMAMADAVEIDGIYYNLVSKIKEAEVTQKPYGYSGVINIPSTVNYNGVEYDVTSIGEHAFSNSKYVTSVVMPNTVINIGKNAFYGCENLTSITISNNLKTIGEVAFRYCYNIESVYISNLEAWFNIDFKDQSSNPLMYGRADRLNHLYLNNKEIVNLEIPSNINTIKAYAFYGAASITSISFHDNILSIGKSAFASLPSLTSLYISDLSAWLSIEFGDLSSNPFCLYQINNNHKMYLNGEEIKDLTIPDNFTSIGDYVLVGMCNLNSITIPNNVTTIGKGAFAGCYGLNFITVPSNVTNIGVGAFKDCINLKKIDLPNKLSTIEEDVFQGCKKMDEIEIPSSVTELGRSSFFDCDNLTSIFIPNNVTKIGNVAFGNCSNLRTIKIGSGIKEIGEKYDKYVSLSGGFSFSDCSEIEDVYCLSEEVPKTQTNTFDNSYIEYATLHVPDASIDLYKVAEPWKNFKEIVGLSGTTPETPKCEKPSISYKSGELSFSSATEGAEYTYEITDTDVKKGYTNEVKLTATYNISVYATKSGYENSDVATATLCWIDSDPKTEGISDGIAQIPAKAVLIQSEGGIVKVEGIDDGTPVTIYTPDGKQAGSAVSRNGAALVGTSIQPGSTAIVKIGEKSVKVVIK